MSTESSESSSFFTEPLEPTERQNLAAPVNGQAVEWVQTLRHGYAADKGRRSKMEDTIIACPDVGNFCSVSQREHLPDTRAFFSVFDGHNGAHAAGFASEHLMSFVLKQDSFPNDMHTAMKEGFLLTDREYFKSCSIDEHKESGTTALAALLWGRRLVIANAGDSRAVLSRKGKAIELSRDHKPKCKIEHQRIKKCGGYVCDEGYLCGELGVARAFGDFHLLQYKDLEKQDGPFTCEPEIQEHLLEPEDEFLILGTDGLWDVLPSQRAVELARMMLREHNDPAKCAVQLVQAALELCTSDNVSVVVMCFSNDAPSTRVYSRTISRDGLCRLATYL